MNKTQQRSPLFRRSSWLVYLVLTALLPGLATAQSPDASTERWFQVELIVFAQGGSPTDGEELWRPDIELRYPNDWLELVDLTQVDSPAPDDAWETVQEEEAQPANNDFWTTAEGDVASAPELSDRALALLPADQLSLRNEVQRLNRNNQYRVLFHGGWHQPLLENQQGPAILITGGDLYDDHYELEGSVQLSLRNYLHVDTNLWLTQFSTNYGQERAPWPNLPRRPNQPIDIIDFMFYFDESSSGLWNQFNQNRDYDALMTQPYVVENIMLLQQSRRMRSGELHYIDHPKMGVLVKLTPYEPEVDTLSQQ